ncbi:PREDICTED: serine/threonine-protein kinase/endoribonuclease IRE1b [Tarenaya hassleriana]|uniref:serine/threonine-protein kinase/endoribonuclease IRE1b n=1 Tax=Tarenaya hassleriana TaxID=28532 RepID=UPI00053C9B34|nr:PREDICTED: serine/threonine-protein kinase/endoribonuclease IRE1b [Tarenaya hassleriana]
MRRSRVLELILILLVSPLTYCFKTSETSKFSQISLSSRTSNPIPDSGHVLVSTTDGTVSLVDMSSKKVDWTFHTGKPIYSSYKAQHYHYSTGEHAVELDDDFYMDCDNDWRLYNCTMHKGKCINEIVDAREFIGRLPYSLSDRIILGKVDTSVFLLDWKTGSLVKTYRLDDMIPNQTVEKSEGNTVVMSKEGPALLGSGFEEPEYRRELVYIERKDYKLQCISKFGDVLWSVSFAEMEAKLQHHEGMQFLGGLSADDIPLTDSKGNNKYQLSYKRNSPVVRLLNYNNEKLFSKLGGVDGALVWPSPDVKPELPPAGGNPLALPGSGDAEIFSLPLPKSAIPEITNILDGNATEMGFADKFYDSVVRGPMQYLILAVIALLSVFGFVFHHSKQRKQIKKLYESEGQAVVPKKKKPKKTRNNKKENGYADGRRNDPSLEWNEKKSLLTFPDLAGSELEGYRVGKLFVSNKEIAKGSNGTVVLEGSYEGRLVAVKRLIQTHHDVAEREISILTDSDKHPNIVRWHGVDYDRHFIYISLERCACSLNDLIFASSKSLGASEDTRHAFQMNPILENSRGMELWKENGHPSPVLLKLMRDIVCGLAHLHDIGIIHRDLKPQNVLIVKNQSLCAKLSDMGISKRLPPDTSALTKSTTGSGSSGWQAPEQLRKEPQTRAIDLFSLGCVLFFCMTAGKHPYGDIFERDINVLNDQKDLFLVESLPEAVDLLSNLLNPDPNLRPRAEDVQNHPVFWSPQTRLSFLRDVSDRVELENREEGSELLAELESTAMVTLNGRWDERMDSHFIDNIGRYRRYRFDSVRDLLRVIRNKLNHYRELPGEIQGRLGSVPEGFDSYFSSRFPKLLIEVYKVICRYCKDEEFFLTYTETPVM